MHEIKTELSEAEMARVRFEAERAGMTVDEFVSHAASAELHRRFLVPSLGGAVLPFRLPTPQTGDGNAPQ